MIQQVVDSGSPDILLAAQFETQSYAGGSTFSQEKAKRQLEKFFPKMHLRGVEVILDAAAGRPKELCFKVAMVLLDMLYRSQVW